MDWKPCCCGHKDPLSTPGVLYVRLFGLVTMGIPALRLSGGGIVKLCTLKFDGMACSLDGEGSTVDALRVCFIHICDAGMLSLLLSLLFGCCCATPLSRLTLHLACCSYVLAGARDAYTSL